MKNKTEVELEQIVRLKPNTSDSRSAALELDRRRHQPEMICGMSVAKLALAIALIALVVSVVAIFIPK